ncbi:MAG: GDP-mannose 4,6-dehydratase, partial [Bacillota bacterium]
SHSRVPSGQLPPGTPADMVVLFPALATSPVSSMGCPPNRVKLRRPSGAGQVNYVSCDLQDAAAVAAALRICRTDLVFHLAARIPHPDPWSSPSATMAVNVLGLINLLEAVLQLKATR